MKEIIKNLLWASIGLNTALFGLGIIMGKYEFALLAILSSVLSLIGIKGYYNNDK